jgi:two-component system, sensor histidine kinase and response regulator
VDPGGRGAAPEEPTGATAPERRVVVIDDDDVILRACRRILQRAGYAVETFDRGAAGIARLDEWRPQILLVDIKMPELDGFQVIQRVRELAPEVVIVVITGYATVETAVEAMKAGAYDFLPKPFTPDELTLIMERSAERWRLAHEAADLRREKEEVERKFVTFVSHQLRTPLVAVRQYLDVLMHTAGDELPETARTWIARSQARLGEMLTLTQDWLTLSKVERGALCERGASADLAAVVGQVLPALQPQADLAAVTVSAAAVAAPCRVGGDEVALSTVVSNLVANAIKYNRAGGKATVSLRTEGAVAVLTIADTGLGIPPEALPCLFTEFFRVSAPDRCDIPGTGLGLAICKRIIDELRGSVAVTSTPGAGSTFEVRLPLAPGPAEAAR